MTSLSTYNQAATSKKAFWALMGSGLVWGLSWWPLKFFGEAGISGHMIGLTAYTLVALLSLPLIWQERLQWRGEWQILLLIGLFFGCANMAFTAALIMGSVVRAMLLFYLLPIWGIMGGALFLNETVGKKRLLAGGLALTGVFIVLGNAEAMAQPLSLADVLALAAGFFYAAAGIANRKSRSLPMLSRTLVSFVGCTAVAITALAVSQPTVPQLSSSVWLWLALFAFIWLLGGTLLTTYGVTHVPASRSSVLQVVEVLVAVASAIVIGGESLSNRDSAGGVLIILATLIEASNDSASAHS